MSMYSGLDKNYNFNLNKEVSVTLFSAAYETPFIIQELLTTHKMQQQNLL